MYITPNTKIYLLRGVPLDSLNINTLSWEKYGSITSQKLAQFNYFLSKKVVGIEDSQFQRVDNKTLKFRGNVTSLYNCNYMMFNNASFENKWFYAFIDSVKYINNDTVEVTYSIDYIQTWYFEYSYQECFIERTHTKIDTIGSNIQPETISTGEYVYNGYRQITELSEMCVIVAIVDKDALAYGGALYDGIYGGAALYVFIIDNTINEKIKKILDNYKEKPDAVLSIYVCPRSIIGNFTDGGLLPTRRKANKINVKEKPITTDDTLDGYKPKNNKLYTYPFNFYHVDNASGSELNLPYEFFKNLTPEFEISGTITQPVSCVLRPFNYKNASITDNTQSLSLTNYPICSWQSDAYEAWIAQNSIPMLTSNLNSMGMSMLLPIAPEITMAMGITKVISHLASTYQASIKADLCKGNISNCSVNVSNEKQQFYGGRCCVRNEQAKVIDNFFSRYGYAINKVEKPSRYNRQKFTYIKTVDCAINGSIPQNHKKEIEKIHDNGITFFVSSSDIGNYTLENNVL